MIVVDILPMVPAVIHDEKEVHVLFFSVAGRLTPERTGRGEAIGISGTRNFRSYEGQLECANHSFCRSRCDSALDGEMFLIWEAGEREKAWQAVEKLVVKGACLGSALLWVACIEAYDRMFDGEVAFTIDNVLLGRCSKKTEIWGGRADKVAWSHVVADQSTARSVRSVESTLGRYSHH